MGTGDAATSKDRGHTIGPGVIDAAVAALGTGPWHQTVAGASRVNWGRILILRCRPPGGPPAGAVDRSIAELTDIVSAAVDRWNSRVRAAGGGGVSGRVGGGVGADRLVDHCDVVEINISADSAGGAAQEAASAQPLARPETIRRPAFSITMIETWCSKLVSAVHRQAEADHGLHRARVSGIPMSSSTDKVSRYFLE